MIEGITHRSVCIAARWIEALSQLKYIRTIAETAKSSTPPDGMLNLIPSFLMSISHRFVSPNIKALPKGTRIEQTRPRNAPATGKQDPTEVEKHRTGDRRTNIEEFYGHPPVPIKIVKTPDTY